MCVEIQVRANASCHDTQTSISKFQKTNHVREVLLQTLLKLQQITRTHTQREGGLLSRCKAGERNSETNQTNIGSRAKARASIATEEQLSCVCVFVCGLHLTCECVRACEYKRMSSCAGQKKPKIPETRASNLNISRVTHSTTLFKVFKVGQTKQPQQCVTFSGRKLLLLLCSVCTGRRDKPGRKKHTQTKIQY